MAKAKVSHQTERFHTVKFNLRWLQDALAEEGMEVPDDAKFSAAYFDKDGDVRLVWPTERPKENDKN